MIVVIPTIKRIELEYIQPFIDSGCRIIVVDDTDDEIIYIKGPNIEVLHYSDRQKILGELANCIPRKNGACRDLGLLMAYLEGEENEIVICLDDDCIIDEDYIQKAEKALGEKTIRIVHTTNAFYNPLDLYRDLGEIFPRGFPYEERGKPKDYSYENTVTGNVVFNLGLWNGVFDVNAIDKLYLDSFTFNNQTLRYEQMGVCKGALLSLCSMNMIMIREVIPAIYQLPMNEPVIPNWSIDRYGDIWGGFICKKLIDIKGDLLSVGEPMIMHRKASKPDQDIRKEHYAHIVNLQFCELISEACVGIVPGSYLDMYAMFCSNLDNLRHKYPSALENYILPTIGKMNNWVRALGKRV